MTRRSPTRPTLGHVLLKHLLFFQRGVGSGFTGAARCHRDAQAARHSVALVAQPQKVCDPTVIGAFGQPQRLGPPVARRIVDMKLRRGRQTDLVASRPRPGRILPALLHNPARQHEGGPSTMTRILCAACTAAALACGTTTTTTELQGSARIDALFSVPTTSVSCIRLVASGMMKSVQKDFAVAGGQTTLSLEMNGIPTGTVMFSGNAYAQVCGNVQTSSVPSWFGDDVTTTV